MFLFTADQAALMTVEARETPIERFRGTLPEELRELWGKQIAHAASARAASCTLQSPYAYSDTFAREHISEMLEAAGYGVDAETFGGGETAYMLQFSVRWGKQVQQRLQRAIAA